MKDNKYISIDSMHKIIKKRKPKEIRFTVVDKKTENNRVVYYCNFYIDNKFINTYKMYESTITEQLPLFLYNNNGGTQ